MSPGNNVISFKSIVIIFIIGIVIYSALSNDKKAGGEPEERYSLPWREPKQQQLVDISKALIKAKITVCGEYYIRKSLNDPGEYLVGCTRDGRQWSYYLVWVPSGNVQGPISGSFLPPY